MQTVLLVWAAVSERTGCTPVTFAHKPDLDKVAGRLDIVNDLFGQGFN
jgi:hypothetical protein